VGCHRLGGPWAVLRRRAPPGTLDRNLDYVNGLRLRLLTGYRPWPRPEQRRFGVRHSWCPHWNAANTGPATLVGNHPLRRNRPSEHHWPTKDSPSFARRYSDLPYSSLLTFRFLACRAAPSRRLPFFARLFGPPVAFSRYPGAAADAALFYSLRRAAGQTGGASSTPSVDLHLLTFPESENPGIPVRVAESSTLPVPPLFPGVAYRRFAEHDPERAR